MHSNPDFLQNLRREIKDVHGWLDRSMVLASVGFLAGLSIGRKGPTVQVAAGILQHRTRRRYRNRQLFHYRRPWRKLT